MTGTGAGAVAVVGLGNMGGSIAARLADGRECVGYDPDTGARERAAAAGVRTVDSLEEAVGDAHVVVTSLPNSPIVRETWLGEQGLLDSARAGALLVEVSTIDPATMVEIASRAHERGFDVLDAPVSGGPQEARKGELTLLVGGSDHAVARSREVFEALGTCHRVGSVGAGKVVKIINNLMTMGNVFVAAEAFSIGVAAGVDPRRLFDVLAVSGGRSHHFVKRFPKALVGDFEPGFTIELGKKDLTLGLELAQSLGMSAPAADAARSDYEAAISQGLAFKDIVALVELDRRQDADASAGGEVAGATNPGGRRAPAV